MKPLFMVISVFISSFTYANGELSEFEQWKQQELQQFQDYLDENDKAFLTFLEESWQAVEVQKAEFRDPKPKPVALPKAPPHALRPLATKPSEPKPSTPNPADSKPFDPKPSDTKPANVVDQIPAELKKQPEPVVTKPIVKEPVVKTPVISQVTPPTTPPLPKPVKPTQVKKYKTAKASFSFYGHQLEVSYPRSFKRIFPNRLSNQKIADYWKYLASQPHKDLVAELNTIANNLKLNDWGSALLFDAFAGQLFSQGNSRQLTTWFLLVKAGFDARIAYDQRIHLLLPAKQELFGVTYFTLDNTRYYAVNLAGKSLKPGKVYTYGKQHKEGQRTLDFSQPTEFLAQGKTVKKTLSFNYDRQPYSVDIQYPSRYVNYFNSFPQLSLPNYFKAGLPAVTAQSLLTQLKPLVKGQPEQEAVNRLLRFVQTAFKYKTDDQQFREENYLFPLETLHYPYSDCEDRAALFAWLVESLMNLDVVILNYPGHVATAVAFNNHVMGDAWRFQGRRYTMADPTYVNANAGMTMPQYANTNPTIESF